MVAAAKEVSAALSRSRVTVSSPAVQRPLLFPADEAQKFVIEAPTLCIMETIESSSNPAWFGGAFPMKLYGCVYN